MTSTTYRYKINLIMRRYKTTQLTRWKKTIYKYDVRDSITKNRTTRRNSKLELCAIGQFNRLELEKVERFCFGCDTSVIELQERVWRVCQTHARLDVDNRRVDAEHDVALRFQRSVSVVSRVSPRRTYVAWRLFWWTGWATQGPCEARVVAARGSCRGNADCCTCPRVHLVHAFRWWLIL